MLQILTEMKGTINDLHGAFGGLQHDVKQLMEGYKIKQPVRRRTPDNLPLETLESLQDYDDSLKEDKKLREELVCYNTYHGHMLIRFWCDSDITFFT